MATQGDDLEALRVRLPDLAGLAFTPAAVLTLEPDDHATVAELVAPLLRAALAVRYDGARCPESVFYSHLAAILERQELMPFAVDGVALAYPDHETSIPVDRSGIEAPVVVVGLCARGVPWRLAGVVEAGSHSTAALDGKPVRAVFLILSGEDRGADIRVKAEIARWRRNVVRLAPQ